VKFKTGFWGFLLGGLTGAAVTLLIAPQSGDETRQLLVENSQQIKEDALASIQKAQESAVATLNEAQTRFDAETKALLEKLQAIGKSMSEEDEINVLDVSTENVGETVSA
jgi:gas vesicle protein